MPKITPYLWFDKEAVEAATFYVSLFENASINNIGHLSDTPSGDVETVDFRLENMHFSAMSAGPFFKLNPSISLMVSCETSSEVDDLYEALIVGGSELMPLGSYGFSTHYVWLVDRFGLNWQLMLVDEVDPQHKIRLSMLFAAESCGKTKEAMNFYQSVFPKAHKNFVNYYAPDEASDPRARINYAEFNIDDLQLVMMDHSMGGEELFNEAFSLMITCEDQAEIDRYWDLLSHVPEAEQCGWVKDPFGVSWQIVPLQMEALMRHGSPEEIGRVTEAFLKMKKIDIEALERARLGQ